MNTTVPESLRYRDGYYPMERFAGGRPITGLREKRILTRTLRIIHRPWFALWLPTGVAALTTVGRRTGRPRTVFVRAYRDGDTAYLVSITGEHALWVQNLRAHPEVTIGFRRAGSRRTTLRGVARDVRSDAERRTIERLFCRRTVPFDYVENLFHRTGLPSRAKIAQLHRAWLDGGTPLVVDIGAASR